MVLNDGQRWAPRDAACDDDGIGRLIQGHRRETRNYGLGGIIVVQSPTGNHNEAVRLFTYFGRGLGVGADQKHPEQNLGPDGCDAYKQLEGQGGFFDGTWARQQRRHREFCPLGGDATTAFIEAIREIFANIQQGLRPKMLSAL